MLTKPLLLLVAFLFSVIAHATVLPENFQLEITAQGLGQATGFDFASGERIYVTTKDGLVYVVQNGRTLDEPFLDISAQVNNAGDRGLMDVAVDPDFPAKPYIYLTYSYDPAELEGMSGLAAPDGRGRRVSRVSRFTADADHNFNKVLAYSEEIIVGKNSTYEYMGSPGSRRSEGIEACTLNGISIEDCMPSDDYSHIVGSLQFAKDGSLYISNGDGATVGPAEQMVTRTLDLDSMAGKILRVNPQTGRGYTDNPFYDGDLNSNRSKVINYGLRNPYGFSLHPITGELVMGDTGWHSWEELNTGRGRNFGWPCYEGGNQVNIARPEYTDWCAPYLENDPQITPAFYAYEHESKGGAVTGVSHYFGYAYPAEYRNAVFFNDFVRGEIYVALFKDSGFQQVRTFASNIHGISKIRQGTDGYLYILDIIDGRLYRLIYKADDSDIPVINMTADPMFGSLPLTVSFSSEGSYDRSGGVLDYSWNFSNGDFSDEPNPQYVFTEKGDYRVELSISDEEGNFNHAALIIQAGNTPPKASIQAPDDTQLFAGGEEVYFQGSVVDQEEGELDVSLYQWRAAIIGGEVSPVPISPDGAGGGSFIFPAELGEAFVELCLSALDSRGLKGASCIDLYPKTRMLRLLSEPPGLDLSFNGRNYTTPAEIVVQVGMQATVAAEREQDGYQFVSWSDQGAASHLLVMPDRDMELSATYEVPSSGGGKGSAGILLLMLLYLNIVYHAIRSKQT